jgi:hypothetical protein
VLYSAVELGFVFHATCIKQAGDGIEIKACLTGRTYEFAGMIGKEVEPQG